MAQELKNAYEQLKLFNPNNTPQQQYELIKKYVDEMRIIKERKVPNMFFEEEFQVKEQIKKIMKWPAEIKSKIIHQQIESRRNFVKNTIEVKRQNLQSQYNLQKFKEMRDRMKKQQRQFDQLPF